MSNLKIFAKTIEQGALDQINTLIAQPAFSDCKVRVMPDVHAGAGCVIGFTADLGEKVIPNVVGVDIGCGMYVACLGKIDIDFEKLDSAIRNNVPSGMNVNDTVVKGFNLKGLRSYDHMKSIDWIEKSMGSLGGGNHFIEIDSDDDGNRYLVIHTGSRNLGKQVCDYYQNLAVETISGKRSYKEDVKRITEEYKAQGRQSEIQKALSELKKKNPNIPKDLCYLEGQDRLDYLHDMEICQRFAVENRKTIAETIEREMGWTEEWSFESVHNYIDHESNIVRKGAISAKDGQDLLIPINMRDGCILGIGKGNDDWNCSAPHGAGRIMSRKQAKETLDLADYKREMGGIFTTSVSKDTIDEAPQAYKPIDEIIGCIKDTVEIVKIIRPVYNFKASE